jgi:hypothetical protein
MDAATDGLTPSILLLGQLSAEVGSATLVPQGGASADNPLDRTTMRVDTVSPDALYSLPAIADALSAGLDNNFDVGEGSFFFYIAARVTSDIGDLYSKRVATGVRLTLNDSRLNVFAGGDVVAAPHRITLGGWYGFWAAIIRTAETGAGGTLYVGDGFASIAELEALGVAVGAANLDDPTAAAVLGNGVGAAPPGTEIACFALYKGAQLAGLDAAELARRAAGLSALFFTQSAQQAVGLTTLASITDEIDQPEPGISFVASAIAAQALSPVVIRPDLFAVSVVDDAGYKRRVNMTLTGGVLLEVQPNQQGRFTYSFVMTGVSDTANVTVTTRIAIGFGHTTTPGTGVDLFFLDVIDDVAAGSRQMSFIAAAVGRLVLGPIVLTAISELSSDVAMTLTYETRLAFYRYLSQ